MKAIKVRVDVANPKHVRVTIFSGDKGYTLHNNGSLCFDHPEYYALIQCLRMGSLMKSPMDPQYTEVVVDDEVMVKFIETSKILLAHMESGA